MNQVARVESEEDVTSLKAGQRIIIDGKLATKGFAYGDGINYLTTDGSGFKILLNLRAYRINHDGSITSVWFSTKANPLSSIKLEATVQYA